MCVFVCKCINESVRLFNSLNILSKYDMNCFFVASFFLLFLLIIYQLIYIEFIYFSFWLCNLLLIQKRVVWMTMVTFIYHFNQNVYLTNARIPEHLHTLHWLLLKYAISQTYLIDYDYDDDDDDFNGKSLGNNCSIYWTRMKIEKE